MMFHKTATAKEIAPTHTFLIGKVLLLWI